MFAGSFDPFTVGHESIVTRALPLFDKIIIAIGKNINKKDFFTLEQRMEWIKDLFRKENKVTVDQYTGLTIDFCKKVNAGYLIRGLRTAADFEYERAIGQMNKAMHPRLEMIYLLTRPEHTAINSSIVRDIIRHGGDAGMFVPSAIDLTKARINE